MARFSTSFSSRFISSSPFNVKIYHTGRFGQDECQCFAGLHAAWTDCMPDKRSLILDFALVFETVDQTASPGTSSYRKNNFFQASIFPISNSDVSLYISIKGNKFLQRRFPFTTKNYLFFLRMMIMVVMTIKSKKNPSSNSLTSARYPK